MLFGLMLALLAADLSPANAPRLKQVWRTDVQAAAPNPRAATLAAFEATPVLAGGLLFVITPYNQVVALDPGTGVERWRFDPHVAADRDYSEVTARGVTVAGGLVYFGTIDARLFAIAAKNGKQVWAVNLSDRPNDGNYQITSPPVVSGTVVIVGSSIGDNGRAEMERGTVRAFDAQTGAPAWSWDPTPSGRTGAANAWAPMSVDEPRDMVFVSTGSASPDFYGGLRRGDDRHANAVVALRASTGAFIWAFQVVHHDLWDYDVASRPELIQIGNKPAIGVLTKVGHYFALDRLTGTPLLPVAERPVPASDIDGEAASPTQPFPDSGVFTAQRFVPRDGWCTEQFQKLRYDGVFTPPSLGGSLVFPGNVGGANWGSGSYDKARGLLFVAANRLATAVRLIPRDAYDSANHGETGERWGQEYGAQAGAPFGMSRRTFMAPDGLPCNQPPWGAIAAIDVATGKLRWEAPIRPGLGGPLAVNGVVFFAGTVFETKIRAFAADDGRLLWEDDLPFSAHSVPGSYVWKGRRYVVVCAGGHGKVDGSKLGSAVVAFGIEEQK